MRKPKYKSLTIAFILIVMLVVTFTNSFKSAQAMGLELLASLTTEAIRESRIQPEVRAAVASMDDEDMITVIVTMRSQADLSNIQANSRRDLIRQVITILQNKANATQLHIRALLEQKKSTGEVADYESFWVFNGLVVTAKASVIDELAARPEIEMITPNEIDVIEATNPAISTALSTAEANLSVVNAPDLWDLGYQGQGIVVANLDSGVDYTHPDLSARWRGGSNSWFDPYGQHPSTPTDRTGHGTWTMGAMVGGDSGGTDIGLAPGAQWIAAKIFNDSGSATAAAIHAAFQWALDPDGNPGTADTPHVVNNSWTNSSGVCDLEFELDLQALRAVGILPVFAAGNAGPASGTSRSPANNPSAFAVGNTTNSDAIYFESSRGPSACGEPATIYPEMVAPGFSIHTTDLYGLYTYVTGTSLSAPHVSGALALLLSADANLTALDQQEALLNGAVDLDPAGPDNDYGYGRLDLLAAYQWLQGGGQSPTPTPIPGNQNLALNKPVTVSSFEDIDHDGNQAVDGNTATFWKTERAKGKNKLPAEWITADLGSSLTIGQVVLQWDANYATSYSIQVSADNNSWAPVYDTTSGNGGTDSVSFAQTSARFVRLYTADWSSGSLRNWLQEFEVYAGSGSPQPTPTPTNTPTPTATPTASPTPDPSMTMHIHDLIGVSAPDARNRWQATVTIVVHDAGENPVDGVTVQGIWSNGASGSSSCVTQSDGSCSLNKGNIKGNVSSVTLTIDQLSHQSLSYDPQANHNGDAVIVFQP